jgi:hypothetical protein
MLAHVPKLSVDQDLPRRVLHAARTFNDATYVGRAGSTTGSTSGVGASWLIAPILSVAAGMWWFHSALTWWHVVTLAAIGVILIAIQLYPFGAAWRLLWLAVVFSLVAVAVLVVGAGRRDRPPPLALELYAELVFAVLLLAVVGDLAHRLRVAWQSRLSRGVAVEQLAVDFIDLAWLAYLGRTDRSRDSVLKEIEQVAARTEWISAPWPAKRPRPAGVVGRPRPAVGRNDPTARGGALPPRHRAVRRYAVVAQRGPRSRCAGTSTR